MSELASLLTKARDGELSAYVRQGECLEVHSCDDSAVVIGVKQVRQFLKDWAHSATWLWHDDLKKADPDGKYIGIVHETGTCLFTIR